MNAIAQRCRCRPTKIMPVNGKPNHHRRQTLRRDSLLRLAPGRERTEPHVERHRTVRLPKPKNDAGWHDAG